jgi:hypothetical protein
MSLGMLGAARAAVSLDDRGQAAKPANAQAAALVHAAARQPEGAAGRAEGRIGARVGGSAHALPLVVVRAAGLFFTLEEPAALAAMAGLRDEGRRLQRGDLIGLAAGVAQALADAHRACERARAFALRGAH